MPARGSDEFNDATLRALFRRVDERFENYDDAIKGLAAMPMHAAVLTQKVDDLRGDVADLREAIKEQQSRRTLVVVAVIGAFATIAAATLSVLIQIVHVHP